MYGKLSYVRVIIYLRQSDDRTQEELAITRQREDLHKLIELRRWTLVGEYVDNDITADGRKRRPGFDDALKAIARGDGEALASRDLDRLTRNARDTMRLIAVGKKARTLLAFVSGTDFNLASADGRTMAGILSSIAQGEIEKKGERQRRAQRQAAEQGRRVGGRRPFGYEPDGVTIRTTEADALIGAYDDVLSGVPMARVAKDFNERGLHTPQTTRSGAPSPWTGQSLRNCLLNPRYAGLRTYLTQDMLEQHGLPYRARIAGIMYGPDGTPVKTMWPALVSEETWRATVDLLTDPGRRTSYKTISRALLSGIARCGAQGCDSRMRTAAGKGKARKWRTYRCADSPGHTNRMAEPIEAYVKAKVVARFTEPDAAELLMNEAVPDFDALRQEAKAVRVKLDSLAGLFVEGVLTEAGVRAQSQTLRARLADIEAKQLHPTRGKLLRPLIEAGAVSIEAAVAAWKAMDIDRQRSVIADLVTVVVFPVRRGTRTFRHESVSVEFRE